MPPSIFDIRTLAMMAAAVTLSVLGLWCVGEPYLPAVIYARALHFIDALFHEMGHAVASWSLGGLAIPSVFTIIGSQDAGGVTLYLGPMHWVAQAIFAVLLLYWAYWRGDHGRSWFMTLALAVAALLVVIRISGYADVFRAYMGHGGAVLAGGFLLYRAWNGAAMRHAAERGLNALAGCYILMANGWFAWKLARDAAFRMEYSGNLIGGAIHHDFVVLSEELGYTIPTLAWMHIGLVMTVVLAATFLAFLHAEAEME